MEKNLKSYKEKLKNDWVFYTDEKLAVIMKDLIDIDYNNVYDPTCWQWNLLSVFMDDIKKFWQEKDNNELEKCNINLNNFIWYVWDTLKDPFFMEMKFDVIVANYPFSIKRDPTMDDRFSECWIVPTQSKADYAFILHILYMMKDDWIAITLNFPWILYRWWKEWQIRKWIIEKNYIDKIIEIDSWYFVDTNIATNIIVFKKNKKNKNILFIDKKWTEKYIEIDEIIKNDYNLSVSQYIQYEINKIYIDPKNMMSNARNQFVIKLRKDIAFDKMVCELEWRDFNIYIDWLIKEIKKFKI